MDAYSYKTPYPDPLRDQLESLEHSIEFSREPGSLFLPDPYEYEDGLSRMLDAVESSIEGMLVESFQPDPLISPPGTFEPTPQGYTSPGPPPPPEGSGRRSDGGLMAPAPARPYLLPDGLASPPLLSHGHGGTGIRHDGGSETTRFCPASNQFVDHGTCDSCDCWDECAGACRCQDEEVRDDRDDEGEENE